MDRILLRDLTQRFSDFAATARFGQRMAPNCSEFENFWVYGVKRRQLFSRLSDRV